MKDIEQTILIGFACKNELDEDAVKDILSYASKQVEGFELIQVLMIPRDEYNQYVEYAMRDLDFAWSQTAEIKRLH